MQDIKGKVSFITGGASGIGLGMARAFAAAGIKVAIADIDETALERAVTTLRDQDAIVLGIRLDAMLERSRSKIYAAQQARRGRRSGAE